MRSVGSLLIAVVGVVLLIGALPIARNEQFPRGLMSSAEPRVSRSCTIETRPLSFGIYDPLEGTDVDAIGQIIYTCESGGEDPGRGPNRRMSSIRIEMAQGYGNSFAPRHMRGLGDQLDYNIYLDATRRQVWGTGRAPLSSIPICTLRTEHR